uniref:Uncharacterized protein n=1 Tax=Helianthus annuus TaxID=4232 RepID=A0A251SL79_HELAN
MRTLGLAIVEPGVIRILNSCFNFLVSILVLIKSVLDNTHCRFIPIYFQIN